MAVKKCPYCAEEIQAEAVKCRFCGEFLSKISAEPWYFKDPFILIAFFCVGPLALPLVWFNPRYNTAVKAIITIVALILSYYLWIWSQQVFNTIMEYYKQMQF